MKKLLLLSLFTTSILIGCHGDDKTTWTFATNCAAKVNCKGVNFSSTGPCRVSQVMKSFKDTNYSKNDLWSLPKSRTNSPFELSGLLGKGDFKTELAKAAVMHLLPAVIDGACNVGAWSFNLIKSTLAEAQAESEDAREEAQEESELSRQHINEAVSVLNGFAEQNRILGGLDEDELRMLADSEEAKQKESHFFREAYENFLSYKRMANGERYVNQDIG